MAAPILSLQMKNASVYLYITQINDKTIGIKLVLAKSIIKLRVGVLLFTKPLYLSDFLFTLRKD